MKTLLEILIKNNNMKGFTEKLEDYYWSLSYQSRKQLYKQVQELRKENKTNKEIEKELL